MYEYDWTRIAQINFNISFLMLSAQIGQCGQCRVIPANSRTQYKYANYVFN